MICTVCGSKDLRLVKYDQHKVSLRIKPFFKKIFQDFDFLIPEAFSRLKKISSKANDPFRGSVKVCRNCGYGVMNTPPSEKELKDYYSGQYWTGRLGKAKEVSLLEKDYRKDPRAKAQVKFTMNRVDKEGIKNVLEIGAGTACASLLLRDKYRNTNLELDVCEPGVVWEKYYKDKGINKIGNYFPLKTSKKYDYIHASHWLEHVLDLEETILSLSDICQEGGSIFIEVPNSAHEYWSLPLKDKPHIHFFTKDSLKRIFKKGDFKCLDIKECGISYFERFNGKVLTPDRYGEREKGLHIRAIFRKTKNF